MLAIVKIGVGNARVKVVLKWLLVDRARGKAGGCVLQTWQVLPFQAMLICSSIICSAFIHMRVFIAPSCRSKVVLSLFLFSHSFAFGPCTVTRLIVDPRVARFKKD